MKEGGTCVADIPRVQQCTLLPLQQGQDRPLPQRRRKRSSELTVNFKVGGDYTAHSRGQETGRLVWPLYFPVAQVESLEPKCPCGSLPGQGLQTLTCHITLPPCPEPCISSPPSSLPAPSGAWNERRCFLTSIPPPCAAPTQAPGILPADTS